MSANALYGNDTANIIVISGITNDIRHKVLFHHAFGWQWIHLSFGLSLLLTKDLLAIDVEYRKTDHLPLG